MSFTSFKKFQGNQAILCSDRIIFNAKKDNIFLLASKDLAVSVGGSVHINVGSQSGDNRDKIFILNSPKIQLGLSDNGETLEPIAKGDQTVSLLNELLTDMESFMNSLIEAKGLVTGGTATLLTINLAAKNMSAKIKGIKEKLIGIKSKTTFSI